MEQKTVIHCLQIKELKEKYKMEVCVRVFMYKFSSEIFTFSVCIFGYYFFGPTPFGFSIGYARAS